MLFSKIKQNKKLWAVVLLLIAAGIFMPQRSSEASVGLIYFRAIDKLDYVMLEWGTGEEISNLGFNLYRATTNDFDDAEQINPSLIPSQGGELGHDYEWPDNDAEIGVTYTYWIEDIDTSDNNTVHLELPATGRASGGGGLPTVPSPGGGNGNSGTATPTPTRTPTRTPSPTTQSGSTATPSRTPTTQANNSSSNPTVTTAVQSQATTASNSGSAPPISQNTPTPEADNEEVISAAAQQVGQTPQPSTSDTGNDLEEETTALSVAQGSSGSVNDSNGELAQGIGQNGAGIGGGEAANNGANSDGSNRSTLIIMALIVSVIYWRGLSAARR
jgi:hypothetical protein